LLIWYIISGFGIMYQEKSGIPAPERKNPSLVSPNAISRGGSVFGLKPDYFHLFSKARLQEWLKLDLFINVSKPAKTRARIMKPEPNPSPQKSGPTCL
jgi:hypothetical protein